MVPYTNNRLIARNGGDGQPTPPQWAVSSPEAKETSLLVSVAQADVLVDRQAVLSSALRICLVIGMKDDPRNPQKAWGYATRHTSPWRRNWAAAPPGGFDGSGVRTLVH